MLPPPSHPAAVVFDMDGVLIDSEHVMRIAFVAAYGEVVGPGEPPFPAFLSHMGLSLAEIMRRLGLPAEMEAAYTVHADANMHRIRVFDGVPEVLGQLASSGLKLAVATGKSTRRATAILERLGLRDTFGAIIGSDIVPNGKPAPDSLFEALRRVDAPADRAVFIGDAVADLECGRNAGVFTIAATWGQTAREVLVACAPDACANALTDIPRMLGLRQQSAGPQDRAAAVFD